MIYVLSYQYIKILKQIYNICSQWVMFLKMKLWYFKEICKDDISDDVEKLLSLIADYLIWSLNLLPHTAS